MNSHYSAVLADLEAMKADAENGIRALRKLMARDGGGSQPAPVAASSRRGNGRALAGRSQQVIKFLEEHPRVHSLAEIATGLGVAASRGLRSTLQRLVDTEKIRRPAPGRFQAVAKDQAG